MIIDNFVHIELNPRNRYIYIRSGYQEKGYDLSCDSVDILVKDLQPTCNAKITVACDYCGKQKQVRYCDYIKSYSKHNIYACSRCRTNITKQTVKDRYGVDNISQIETVKSKKKETCFNNFGCEYPMQNEDIRNKSTETMLVKYGVKHNLQRPDIANRVKTLNSHVKYERGNAPSSAAQRHIAEITKGELNYPELCYNLDVLLRRGIYLEYNGSGHDLCVRLGQTSKEKFICDETIRYNRLKELGYKCIIIDNKDDILPEDYILFDIISKCEAFLLSSIESNWIRVDLCTMKIKTKNTEIFYHIQK